MSEFPIVHRVAGKFPVLPNHVNAYLVELEKSAVVVDSTIALSSARQVRDIADSVGKPIEAVLLTHGHPDHYSGLKVFEDLPRLASQGCLDFAKQEDAEKGDLGKAYHGDDYPDPRVFPNEIVKDGDRFTFGGLEFRFYDLGPGESDSDGMWLVESDIGKHVFFGDIVANDCHCFFHDGHIEEWMRILDRLEKDFDASTRFYYGHGEAPSGLEAVAWQRGYNQAFLNAVRAVEDKSLPVGRETEEKTIATVKEYLPNDATLFLLDYDLGGTMAALWKKWGSSR